MVGSRNRADDAWVRSHCDYCLNNCGVLAHRVGGVVVKIEGDPDNPTNYGTICAKGNAAFLHLYNPKRIKTPLMRTNTKKGIGIEPEFKPISWDEALDTVAERLKKIRARDPNRLYFATFDLATLDLYRGFCFGFGTFARPFSAGFYCGNNVHPIHEMNELGVEADPDPDFCKYFLLVGSQFGGVVNYDVMRGALGIASKRPGGVKVVAVDPIGNYASRAEEWIPIRPGTDAAFLLSVANLLMNDYKIYDSKYVKHRTNAPYLIDSEGHYVRDPETKKPLVWDSKSDTEKSFNDETIADFALEGTYLVGGKECRPSFEVLKTHVKKYSPDYSSEVTTIPAQTIRRIAKEFGEAASIGQVITIGGKQLPYRPVACVWYRGLSAHKHSMLSGMAAETLNVLMGAVDVPGGLLASGQLPGIETEEGLLTAAPGSYLIHPAYPPRKVVPPISPDLFELFPVATYSRPFFIMAMLKPEVYKCETNVEMLMQVRANFVKTSVPSAMIDEVMRKIPFMVSFSQLVDETAEYADIVFPDLHYLERVGTGLNQYRLLDRSGKLPEKWYGQKPVVEASIESPWGKKFASIGQVLLALAERADFLDDVYKSLNFLWELRDPYRLEPGKRYEFEDLINRFLMNRFGKEMGWGWFMKDGLYVKERPPEKMYPGAFHKGRVHLYYEFMIKAGEQGEEVTSELGIPWEKADYQPLPDWKPCPSYEKEKSEEFDLYLINYKVPQQGFSITDKSNQILQQLTDKHRDNDVLMNTETGKRKGFQDGDHIVVENRVGVRGQARVRLTELVHPEVLACQGNSGRFAKSMAGKEGGIHFNDMIIFDHEHVDYVSTALDSCIRVKISKDNDSNSR